MINVFFWAILYSVMTSLSIALLGDKELISGKLFQISNFLKLIIHWKFILAMILAVGSRTVFVIINNTLLGLPKYYESATTITAFIAAIAFIFVIITNKFLLDETLSTQQIGGAITIVIGIWFMMK